MITKKGAKEFTYRMTISSLRGFARRLTSGDIGGGATQKDVVKVRAEMEALAKKLEGKVAPGRVIDVPVHLEAKDEPAK